MNRRKVVKQLAAVSGALISLPFWMEACHLRDKPEHLSSFSVDEQSTLAKVTDAIIPAGGSIGALTEGVDKFLQKLIDDCYEKPAQDNIKRQLAALDKAARTTYGSAFSDCSLEQRQVLLMKWQASSDKDEKTFFDSMKSETIRGFTTSQKVMEGYYHYKVAPGHYYGCITVNG